MSIRLLDSNILIYYLGGAFSPEQKRRVGGWIKEGATASGITRIEVLGFRQGPEELRRARALFGLLDEVPLSEPVVERTIALRQQHRIKLPDAVIAASALVRGAELVTRNTVDFDAIPGLALVNLFER